MEGLALVFWVALVIIGMAMRNHVTLVSLAGTFVFAWAATNWNLPGADIGVPYVAQWAAVGAVVGTVADYPITHFLGSGS